MLIPVCAPTHAQQSTGKRTQGRYGRVAAISISFFKTFLHLRGFFITNHLPRNDRPEREFCLSLAPFSAKVSFKYLHTKGNIMLCPSGSAKED